MNDICARDLAAGMDWGLAVASILLALSFVLSSGQSTGRVMNCLPCGVCCVIDEHTSGACVQLWSEYE